MALDLEKLKKRESELDVLQQDPNLFKDLKRAQEINIEAKNLKDKLKEIESVSSALGDLATAPKIDLTINCTVTQAE